LLGRACQTTEWIEKLSVEFETCVYNAMGEAEDLPDTHRIEVLEKYIDVMCEDSQKPPLFLEIATVLSHAGIKALSTKDFLPALQALHDCHRPIEEIRRLTRENGDMYSEASVIESDVAFHMATASALQAIRAGICSSVDLTVTICSDNLCKMDSCLL